MKIFIFFFFFLFTQSLTYSDVISDFPYKDKFREKGENLIKPLSDPWSVSKVRKERFGEGWRTFTTDINTNKHIIWLDGHGSRSMRLNSKYIYKSMPIVEKFSEKNVMVHMPILKQNRENPNHDSSEYKDNKTNVDKPGHHSNYPFSKYARYYERIEVAYHIYQYIIKKFGEDSKICFYGHSEGSNTPIILSAFLNDSNIHYVASGHVEKGQKKLFQERISEMNNLTLIFGEFELDHKKAFDYWDMVDDALWTKSFAEKNKLSVKIIPNAEHTLIRHKGNFDNWGPVVLESCNFK